MRPARQVLTLEQNRNIVLLMFSCGGVGHVKNLCGRSGGIGLARTFRWNDCGLGAAHPAALEGPSLEASGKAGMHRHLERFYVDSHAPSYHH